MRYFYLMLVSLFYFTNTSSAQYSHQDVLLGQSGNGLITNLRLNYKPSSLTDYGTARDNMFSRVYRENDTVTCVYTGLKRYLPAGAAAPRTIMLDNNSTISVNTEHTYPQSKTINDAGKSDLHHMYPSRAAANGGRGSVPLGEISPSNIDKWYFEANTLSSPPPANVAPLHSKQDNNILFEPRDDHKGNAARAIFYYYTMYQNEANAADPNFFNNQKATLCKWHLEDPVDSLEWVRTSRIALLQQNKVNPFVMDCTLPERCGFCDSACARPNAISMQEVMGLELLQAAPNPAKGQTTIYYELNQTQEVAIYIYNVLGQPIREIILDEQTAGLHEETVSVENLPNGIYVYQLQLKNSLQSAAFTGRFVVQQ